MKLSELITRIWLMQIEHGDLDITMRIGGRWEDILDVKKETQIFSGPDRKGSRPVIALE